MIPRRFLAISKLLRRTHAGKTFLPRLRMPLHVHPHALTMTVGKGRSPESSSSVNKYLVLKEMVSATAIGETPALRSSTQSLQLRAEYLQLCRSRSDLGGSVA